MSETSENLSAEKQEIVEIKLWSLYLLNNSTNLYSAIIESSIDHGPVEKNPQNPGRITFRFNVKEFESKIKKLLYSFRIPVIVKSQLPYQTAPLGRQRMMV